jgi:hypothetical protein
MSTRLQVAVMVGQLVTFPSVLGSCGGHLPSALEPPSRELPGGAWSLDSSARGWYLRAVFDEAKGDVAAAEYAFAWALRLEAEDGWLRLAYARFLERQGRVSEAETVIAEARAILDQGGR